MKNKTERLSPEQARALFQQQGKKKPPDKKPISGKEQLDLSSTEVSRLIDTLLLKVPEYVGYHEEKILCLHQGREVEITFKIKPQCQKS